MFEVEKSVDLKKRKIGSIDVIGPGIVSVTVAIPFAAFEARDAPRIAVNIYVAVTMLRAHIIIMKFQFVMAHILRASSIAIRVSASTLRQRKGTGENGKNHKESNNFLHCNPSFFE